VRFPYLHKGEVLNQRRSSKKPFIAIVIVLAIAVVAAIQYGLLPGAGEPSIFGSKGTPVPTRVPLDVQAKNTVNQFISAWQSSDYDAMYALVSSLAQEATPKDRFKTRYQSIKSGMSMTALKVDQGALEWPGKPNTEIGLEASVPITVTMSSSRFGDLVEQKYLQLTRDDTGWRVKWEPSLILNGLRADNVVRVDTEDPVRGTILDRKGRVLAGQGKILSIGLIPGSIKDEAAMLVAVSEYLGIDKDAIKAKYANAKPDWWVPLRDLSMDRMDEAKKKLGGIAGVVLREKDARVYPEKQLASQVLGYCSSVTAEDLQKLATRGYEDGDLVGRVGIESWAEEILAGKKGGKMVIADTNGVVERVVAERPAVAGGRVQLTIDIDLQRKAEQALGDRASSVVLLDAKTNAILALASHPTFDPNSFVVGISDDEWKKLSEDKRYPFQNRPALSAYPPGSIFKVVTTAAALEKGGFVAGSPFTCTGQWTAPGGLKMGCWVLSGHGNIDLAEGLTESCDVVFYEVSQALNKQDPNLLSSYARQFGLGKATGVVGLLEAEGTVPDSAWKETNMKQEWFVGDAANLAIGQGYLETTPLQMANLYSSLANDGIMRNPVLVSLADDGTTSKKYQADQTGQLPVSSANLKIIREAMKRVTGSPKGTAYYAFEGFKTPTAGKTGSAENQNAQAHAWFAGYAPADQPQVVVLAMVEGGEHGAEVAAPLGRQLLEAYFAQK
jgi:penicillin-binding protein 2